MGGGPGRHAELATELAEWWEDLWQAHIGSQVVLVAVPAGWGRSTVLDRFVAGIDARDDAPVTLTVRIESQALRALETAGLRSQALARALPVQVLRADLGEAAEQHRVVQLLGLDEPAVQVQLGLGVANLFFPGLTAGISFLVAGLLAGAAGKAWDASPAGQDGALARTARAVAAVSVEAPVTVVIDDADCLDVDLAVTMVENLTARQGSQVLIIAVVDPGSALPAALRSRVRHGLTSNLVYDAEADPDMGYESRLGLARELRPDLPDAGARRIAQRTTTFAEVFTVAAAPRLAEFGQESDPAEMLAVVDAAASAPLARPKPSPEATVIAWARGLVHARQAEWALGILGATRHDDDPDVRRWESLERLAGPATPRLDQQVTADLTAADRRAIAAAFLEEALTISQAPGATLIDKVAALRAAHRVRGDLPGGGQLPRAQCDLVAALEALGDVPAALQVATDAMAGWPAGREHQRERDTLAAAVIRLSRMTPQSSPGPLAEQLIAEAAAGGAAAGLEARIWAATVLLDTPGQRDTALTLADQATTDLEARRDLGPYEDRWRLLLAYHIGRAGLPDTASRLLGPLITSSDPARQNAARMVRRALDEPRADIRLQNILLEAELDALPPEADDDRLRIHHALAANHHTLGDYHQALAHAQHELDFRTRIQGPDHPDTLETRRNIADWTGECEEHATALALARDLLPDQERILGPHDSATLATRGSIAYWTGECGDPATALQLLQDLLTDQERALGPHDSATLVVRGNIARWTAECGAPPTALALARDLLPDMERILGPHDPHTLTTRAYMAEWTGECGELPTALALARDLLPDMERTFGRAHPDTLAVRGKIALLTGECGELPTALALARDLLPDMERILGPHNPNTLTVRGETARWTGECGDPATALRLYQELLPDIERTLGPHDPNTLATRNNIAHWTSECGDPATALRLYQELLPDIECTLGPHDPNTLAARARIGRLTGEGGHDR